MPWMTCNWGEAVPRRAADDAAGGAVLMDVLRAGVVATRARLEAESDALAGVTEAAAPAAAAGVAGAGVTRAAGAERGAAGGAVAEWGLFCPERTGVRGAEDRCAMLLGGIGEAGGGVAAAAADAPATRLGVRFATAALLADEGCEGGFLLTLPGALRSSLNTVFSVLVLCSACTTATVCGECICAMSIGSTVPSLRAFSSRPEEDGGR